jgi:8-oxo-dGTP diphosphatase
MLKVTCALIITSRKLLITQNGLASDHPLQWEFPGGKIKQNETSEDCVVREIKEELEIKVNILQKLNHVVFDYGIKKIELMPFICEVKSGTIQLKEHINFKWIELNELLRFNLSGADMKVVQEQGNIKTLEKYLGEKMYNS